MALRWKLFLCCDSADAGITDNPPLHDGGAFRAQARLVALARSHGLKVASRILTSIPDTSAAILAEAGKIKADLIILGHRGNSGAEDLGPVVKEVSRRAPCSVLIVR